jgi:subtilisin family serine protease
MKNASPTHADGVAVAFRNVWLWPLVAGLMTSANLSLRAADNSFQALAHPAEASVALPNANPPRAEFAPGEVLVGFQPGAARRADAVRQGLGAQKLKDWPAIQAQHWKLPPGLTVERAVEILSRNPNVEFAEPNYIYEAVGFPSDPPNDPYRNELWGLHNLGQSGGTPRADIDALRAWAQQQGSDSVVVAVIDTGIDYTHPDLAANIWINPGETAGNGLDDDGNGFIDDVMGWDFVNNDNDPMDDNGHGTHVSGTLGGLGNNGVGVIGVSPIARLMPVKFLNQSGSGTTDAAVSAILYAAGFNVRISNNSWGGGSKSRTLENAIKNSGALFCAAAGNAGSSTVMYPAGYKLANVVSVAATDHNDGLASFSNFGSSWVHLAAPGVNVFSTIPNGSYRFANGTSMATPHVAGALALLRAEFPGWDNAALKSRLLATVDAKDSLAGKVSSGGRLNVANALGAPPLPTDSTAPNAVGDLAAGDATQTSVTLSWTATGDDGALGTSYLYDLRFSTAPITPGNWSSATLVVGLPLPQASGATESVTVNRLQPGTTFYFALRAVDEAGNASDLSNVAVAATLALDWEVEIVDADNDSRLVGRYSSLAFHPVSGTPAVLYDDSIGNIHFATRGASAWTTELVGPAKGGVSLAYDPSGATTASWIAPGKMGKGGVETSTLFFGVRSASGWNKVAVQANLQLGPEITSLAYGPGGMPAISFDQYSNTRGLRFAWREGSTWKTQLVDANCHPRYNSLAFAPNGNPAIAYSRDVDADGLLDTVMYAEGVWNGSGYTWTISTAHSTGAIGGVFASLAFDSAGNPVITHRTRPPDSSQYQVTLVQRVGGVWQVETVANGDLSFSTVDPWNNAHVAYRADGALNVASAPLDGSGAWVHSIADSPATLFWPGSIRIAPDGLPAVTYRTGGLRFAKHK